MDIKPSIVLFKNDSGGKYIDGQSEIINNARVWAVDIYLGFIKI